MDEDEDEAAVVEESVGETSEVPTDILNTYCTPCAKWHERGKPCPLCKRSLLLG